MCRGGQGRESSFSPTLIREALAIWPNTLLVHFVCRGAEKNVAGKSWRIFLKQSVFLIAWLRLLWKYSGFHVALARRWLFANLTAAVCSQLKLLKDAPPQVCIFYCLLLSNFTLIRLHDDLLCCLNPKGPSYTSQGHMGNFFRLLTDQHMQYYSLILLI